MTFCYELKNVKVIHDDVCTLDIPSLSLESNQCIALHGDNGAGKSTLLNLLAFTSSPTTGEINFQGQPASMPLQHQQRKQIGYVAQQPLLLNGTVSDNIRLALRLQKIPSRDHSSCIEQALTRLDIMHLANKSATVLSGGEMKRVAIARALSFNPAILLLDEPFSHLDQQHCRQLESIIDSLSTETNTTLIFSTHNRLHGTAIADRVINLAQGRVIESPLINLYSGHLTKQMFDTGQLQIELNNPIENIKHIAIDPHQIILAHHALQTSMRNQYQGKIIGIAQQNHEVLVTVNCGEIFHIIISHNALNELKLSLGQTIWISFKSSAVTAF
jgi:molybdopterin-binding protein